MTDEYIIYQTPLRYGKAITQERLYHQLKQEGKNVMLVKKVKE